MAVSKIARRLLTFLLLSLPLFGQYSSTPSMSLVNNVPWCISHNCLTAIGGNTSETKVGADGTIWGLSGHAIYKYSSRTWTQLASGLQTAGGLAINHISVGTAKNALAISAATSGDNVYTLNSAGTAWVVKAGQFCTTAEIGQDGDIWCLVYPSGAIYHWTGSAWALMPGALSSISVGSSRQVWGLNSAGHLYQWTSTGWVNVPISGFTPKTTQGTLSVQDVEGPFLLLLDTSSGIHLSANGGTTWATLVGTANLVAGGGAFSFVHSTAGVSYHINTVAPAITNTQSGTWNCPVGPGCPSGSFHTLKATAKFGGIGGAHGTAGLTAQTQGYPTNYLNVIATETGSNCDPIFGDTTTPECTPATSGTADCSMMGALQTFSFDGSHPDIIGAATTGGTYIPGSAYYDTNGPDGKAAVICGTQDSCTAATTPPRCNIPDIAIIPDVGESPDQECSLHGAWLVTQPTFHIPFFGWVCATGLVGQYSRSVIDVQTLGPNSPVLPYACTKP